MHGLHPGLLVKSAAWLVGVGITLVAFSCDPELSLKEALRDKPCAAVEPRCWGDDVCNSENVCKPPRPPTEDPGGAGATDAGGADGSETNGDGMDTMSSDVPDAADATPRCILVQLFRDWDGDGFGSGEGEPRCPSDGWVPQGGDCLDTDDSHALDVHPGQRDFFSEGYPRPGQPSEISFDYDCSGVEEADPANSDAAGGDESDCAAASPGFACGTLNGVLPAPAPRSGASVNAQCGSKTVLFCNMMGDQCVPTTAERPNAPSRCH
jgi:hypothetical protein